MINYHETKDVPLSQLAPFPGNARRGDVDGIAASIETNGQYRSLIVRGGGAGYVVLAGNHTAAALRKLGSPTARCEIITCDDATATRINLVDNKLPDSGGYDDTALAALLQGIDDFTGTGYTSEDLDDLLATLGEAESVPSGESGDHEPVEPAPASGSAVELIVVMPVGDHQEATALIRSIRDRDGQVLTAGQVVLYALRVHAGVTDEEEEDDE